MAAAAGGSGGDGGGGAFDNLDSEDFDPEMPRNGNFKGDSNGTLMTVDGKELGKTTKLTGMSLMGMKFEWMNSSGNCLSTGLYALPNGVAVDDDINSCCKLDFAEDHMSAKLSMMWPFFLSHSPNLKKICEGDEDGAERVAAHKKELMKFRTHIDAPVWSQHIIKFPWKADIHARAFTIVWSSCGKFRFLFFEFQKEQAGAYTAGNITITKLGRG